MTAIPGYKCGLQHQTNLEDTYPLAKLRSLVDTMNTKGSLLDFVIRNPN